jgi:hypothetical protein
MGTAGADHRIFNSAGAVWMLRATRMVATAAPTRPMPGDFMGISAERSAHQDMHPLNHGGR